MVHAACSPLVLTVCAAPDASVTKLLNLVTEMKKALGPMREIVAGSC